MDELIRLFKVFNIELEISLGVDFSSTIAMTIQQIKLAFYEIFEQEVKAHWPIQSIGSSARVLIVNDLLIAGKLPLGAMVHPKRGGCAIAMAKMDTQESFLQTCAHEIGHLLNLTHEHANEEDFTTVMKQSWNRDGSIVDIKNAWNISGKHWPNITSYPFSQKSGKFFLESEDEKLFPWGEDFPVQSDIFDIRQNNSILMSIKADNYEYSVGDCLSYEIEINNQSHKKIEIPASITPDFGNVFIRITRPNNETYIHRPRFTACCDKTLTLLAGDKYIALGLLDDGPGGAVFPIDGLYRIELCCPVLKLISSCSIFVSKDGYAANTSTKRFRRLIAEHAPGTTAWYRKKSNNIINCRHNKKSPLPGLLALQLARQTKSTSVARKLFNIALENSSPRTVRHEAAISYILNQCCNINEVERFQAIMLKQFNDPLRDNSLYGAIEKIKTSIFKEL